MKSRSVKRRAASTVVIPLPTEMHPFRRGNHALAAPLILPAYLDEAVSQGRASLLKKSITPAEHRRPRRIPSRMWKPPRQPLASFRPST